MQDNNRNNQKPDQKRPNQQQPNRQDQNKKNPLDQGDKGGKTNW